MVECSSCVRIYWLLNQREDGDYIFYTDALFAMTFMMTTQTGKAKVYIMHV